MLHDSFLKARSPRSKEEAASGACKRARGRMGRGEQGVCERERKRGTMSKTRRKKARRWRQRGRERGWPVAGIQQVTFTEQKHVYCHACTISIVSKFVSKGN